LDCPISVPWIGYQVRIPIRFLFVAVYLEEVEHNHLGVSVLAVSCPFLLRIVQISLHGAVPSAVLDIDSMQADLTVRPAVVGIEDRFRDCFGVGVPDLLLELACTGIVEAIFRDSGWAAVRVRADHLYVLSVEEPMAAAELRVEAGDHILLDRFRTGPDVDHRDRQVSVSVSRTDCECPGIKSDAGRLALVLQSLAC
jgi:hypothetical protein